jgi:imidazolonepropionase-like amidohydrolase
MRRTALLAIMAASLAATAQLQAQDVPVPKSDYALTGVRIVTAPGRVIERGTILMRDGRIAAVGAQVNVPTGVVQMNLSGHTVYPGLIDAATSVGLPSTNRPPSGGAAQQAAAPAGRGGRGGGGGVGRGGQGRGGGGGGGGTAAPLVLPEIDAGAEAAMMFAPSDEELNSLRSGGITTVGLMFNGGLFPGRVGAALTGGYNESQLVLRTEIGQQVSFGSRRGGYPGTGIGALAYVKQSFLDAQHELALENAFKAGKPGARPTYDPMRRALLPVASNQMPAWFAASTEREIQRVVDIARELGLRNWIVVGAQEGWRTVPNLKLSGAPVVVSLDWPTMVTGSAFQSANSPAPGVTPSTGRGGGAAATAAIRANAIELAKAEIPVVFASFGGSSGTTFRDRLSATVEAGMSRDDALRAATVAPAALLGISAAVGTIENGKLANLVVVNGDDLFAPNASISHVFVEGRLYNPTAAAAAPPAGGRGRGGSPAPAARRSSLRAPTK